MTSDEIIKKAEEYALKSGWSCIDEQLAGAEAFAIKQAYIDAYTQGRADAWRWREYPKEKPTDNNFCLVLLDDGGTMQSHYSLPDDDWIDDAPITHWLPIKLPGGEND